LSDSAEHGKGRNKSRLSGRECEAGVARCRRGH
jgi:hypothetical protein